MPSADSIILRLPISCSVSSDADTSAIHGLPARTRRHPPQHRQTAAPDLPKSPMWPTPKRRKSAPWPASRHAQVHSRKTTTPIETSSSAPEKLDRPDHAADDRPHRATRDQRHASRDARKLDPQIGERSVKLTDRLIVELQAPVVAFLGTLQHLNVALSVRDLDSERINHRGYTFFRSS